MIQKLRGIILKATKYSEADLILNVLSQTGEKYSIIAKGALKSKKRFGGGVLQPSHFVEFTFKKGLTPEKMGTVDEAVLINGFERLRTDYDRMEVVFFILDCLNRVSQAGDVGSVSLFDLAGHSLKSLETAKNVDLLQLHFGLKLMFQQGVLEPEGWMKPFLALPMKDHSQLIDYGVQFNPNHLVWLSRKIDHYLKTGHNDESLSN